MSEISLKSHLPIPEVFRERNSITSKECLLNPDFWKQKSPLKQLKIKAMVDCLQGIWAVFCGHSIAKATAPWSQHCVNNNWASIQGSVHPVLTLIRHWLHPPEALNFLGEDYFSFRFMYTHTHTQKENTFSYVYDELCPLRNLFSSKAKCQKSPYSLSLQFFLIPSLLFYVDLSTFLIILSTHCLWKSSFIESLLGLNENTQLLLVCNFIRLCKIETKSALNIVTDSLSTQVRGCNHCAGWRMCTGCWVLPFIRVRHPCCSECPTRLKYQGFHLLNGNCA